MMISHNTLLQQSLSGVLQSPHYNPLKQKINTDQLNNACLAIVVNYNTLINYEQTNLPVDRYDNTMVTLQNEGTGDQRKLTKNKIECGPFLKTLIKLN